MDRREDQEVFFTREDGIAVVTLNRPEKMNSLTGGMMRRLGEIWESLRHDDSVRVVIVTGAGTRAFCAGRDLMASAPGGPEYHRERRTRGEPTDDTGLEPVLPLGVPQPVIAAVNGHCLAGGFALALACDLRIASDTAMLGTAGVNRGLLAGGGQTQRLVRYLPFGIAMEMLLYGHSLDASRALQYGLVNAVTRPDDLMTVAREWAERLIRNAPLAVRASKELAYGAGLELSFGDALRLENRRYNDMLETEDVLEGARAFAERRDPIFRGR